MFFEDLEFLELRCLAKKIWSELLGAVPNTLLDLQPQLIPFGNKNFLFMFLQINNISTLVLSDNLFC